MLCFLLEIKTSMSHSCQFWSVLIPWQDYSVGRRAISPSSSLQPYLLRSKTLATDLRSSSRNRASSSSQESVSSPEEPDFSMEGVGLDSDGRQFNNAAEMWREHLGNEGDAHKRVDWYRSGVDYWKGVEASVDGVLGGYGHVNDADVKASAAFLQSLLSEITDGGKNCHLVALDCGAGIGRVTKNLLIRFFNEVDLLEPVPHFLEAARESLDPANFAVTDGHKTTNFFCTPLQEFTPVSGRYDVIWIQWCIGHLVDDDFISFFKRAKAGLKPGGIFVLKENIAKNGFVLDKEDRSVTRSDSYFKELFKKCGLHLYKMKDQKGFPGELFAVKMYALNPNATTKSQAMKSKLRSNRPGIIK